MPEFVLNRNHTLQHGAHCINFVKGQPTWVPPALIKVAASIGAEAVDGTAIDPLADESPEVYVHSAEERIEELVKAISKVCAKNDSKDFGGDNRPTVTALDAILPFTTSKKEVAKAWDVYKAKQAE